MEGMCPYCKIRPKKKATCGAPQCRIAHQNAQTRNWYKDFKKKNGEGYRRGWRRQKVMV